MSTLVPESAALQAPHRAGRQRGGALLSIKGLKAFYGELRALEQVSLDVMQGQILAVIGANGAGKSTLLKAVVGLMNKGRAAHIEGEITFGGRRLDQLATREIVDAGVTLVPEGRRLFQRLSVRDNLLCGAYLKRCQASAPQQLEEVFALFPRLSERSEQVASQMSGGEQQMVAIGRALMSAPQLILFDEISLGLSPRIVSDIYRKVALINRQGVTCIVIEQDVQRALSVADYVVVLREGRGVLEGAPGALRAEQVSAAYFGAL